MQELVRKRGPKVFLIVAVVILMSVTFLVAANLSQKSAKGAFKVNKNDTKPKIEVKKAFEAEYKKNSLILEINDPLKADSVIKNYRPDKVKKITSEYSENNYYEMEFANADIKKIYNSLQADNLISYVQPNYKIQKNAVIPNDPSYSLMWNLHRIRMSEAWELHKGDSSVVVAIIDTGIEYTHSDLAANIWKNTGEIAGNGIDDDGNGYVDDDFGFDFVNGTYNTGTKKWINDANGPMDDNGHGTHVAGTIGAVTNNNAGVSGISWFSKLMALKALDNKGAGYTSNAMAAVYYAANNGAKIINCSFAGAGRDLALKDAIDYAYNVKGVLIVAAAGNESQNLDITPSYPASEENVIAVSAIDRDNNRASFSNYGSKIEVAAPGVDILSARIGNNYAYSSGTSMATSHVSGLAALIAAKNPLWTNFQIRRAIREVSFDLSPTGRDVNFGFGRIDALNSLQLNSPPPAAVSPQNSQFILTANNVTAGGQAVLNIVLKDQESNVIPGHLIQVTSSVGNKDTIVQPGQTAGDGTASATISSTFAGVRTLTLTNTTASVILTSTLQLTFVPAVFYEIEILPDRNKLMPITSNRVLITVKANDFYGNSISGRKIALSGLRERDLLSLDNHQVGNSVITGGNGIVVLTLKSSELGSVNLNFNGGIGGGRTFFDLNIPVVKIGDFSGDSKVDVVDFSIFLGRWKQNINSLEDINCDGKVDVIDFSIFLGYWKT